MFGKEKTFQDVTGMTEDEFRAKVAELDALKASDAERSAKIQEQETSISELRESLRALQAPPKTPADPKAPTGFYEDPDKAFAERIAPLAQHTLQTNARLEETIARNKYSREYKLWGKEIDEMVKNHPDLSQKGNPAFYDNVVDIIKGRHMEEILDAERKGQSLFLEPAQGGGVGRSTKDDTAGLTRDQLAAATRMGIKPEDFKAQYDALMEARGVRTGNA